MNVNNATFNPYEHTGESNKIQNSNSNEPNSQVSGVMGKDDFLMLFLTSLQMQDPMEPMDNSEMMQQMSQLSMIEQINNMTTAVESLKESNQGNPMDSSVHYIDKTVSGFNEDGERIEGKVDEIQLENERVKLMIGSNSLFTDEVRQLRSNPYSNE